MTTDRVHDDYVHGRVDREHTQALALLKGLREPGRVRDAALDAGAALLQSNTNVTGVRARNLAGGVLDAALTQAAHELAHPTTQATEPTAAEDAIVLIREFATAQPEYGEGGYGLSAGRMIQLAQGFLEKHGLAAP